MAGHVVWRKWFTYVMDFCDMFNSLKWPRYGIKDDLHSTSSVVKVVEIGGGDLNENRRENGAEIWVAGKMDKMRWNEIQIGLNIQFMVFYGQWQKNRGRFEVVGLEKCAVSLFLLVVVWENFSIRGRTGSTPNPDQRKNKKINPKVPKKSIYLFSKIFSKIWKFNLKVFKRLCYKNYDILMNC